MNEGFLGKFSFGGERAATDDHPVVLHALPLAASVTAAFPAGTLLKKVDVTQTSGEGESAVTTVIGTAYAPLASASDAASPCAVADKPCDPTGDQGEKSAIAVVHGTVKARVLVTGDGKAATEPVLVKLMENGVFAV